MCSLMGSPLIRVSHFRDSILSRVIFDLFSINFANQISGASKHQLINMLVCDVFREHSLLSEMIPILDQKQNLIVLTGNLDQHDAGFKYECFMFLRIPSDGDEPVFFPPFDADHSARVDFCGKLFAQTQQITFVRWGGITRDSHSAHFTVSL